MINYGVTFINHRRQVNKVSNFLRYNNTGEISINTEDRLYHSFPTLPPSRLLVEKHHRQIDCTIIFIFPRKVKKKDGKTTCYVANATCITFNPQPHPEREKNQGNAIIEKKKKVTIVHSFSIPSDVLQFDCPQPLPSEEKELKKE